jgi:hypothetical protein
LNFSPALSVLTSAGVATVPPVTIVYTTPTAAPTAQAATATAIGKIDRMKYTCYLCMDKNLQTCDSIPFDFI